MSKCNVRLALRKSSACINLARIGTMQADLMKLGWLLLFVSADVAMKVMSMLVSA